MVEKTVTIENDLFNTFVHGPLRKQFSGISRLGDFAFERWLILHRFFIAAGSNEGRAGGIINDLTVDVFGTSKNGKSGSFRCADNFFGNSFFTFQPDFSSFRLLNPFSIPLMAAMHRRRPRRAKLRQLNVILYRFFQPCAGCTLQRI